MLGDFSKYVFFLLLSQKDVLLKVCLEMTIEDDSDITLDIDFI